MAKKPERKKEIKWLLSWEYTEKQPLSKLIPELQEILREFPDAYFTDQPNWDSHECGIAYDWVEPFDKYQERIAEWEEKERASLERRIAKTKAKLKEMEDASASYR